MAVQKFDMVNADPTARILRLLRGGEPLHNSIVAAVVGPSFDLESAVAPERIIAQVHRRLTERACPVGGLTASERIELHVAPDRQHLWSPQLVIDLRCERGRTTLHGEFGPHPYVWFLYVAVVALTMFGCLVGGSFGMAQLTMGQSPTALWSLPLMLVILVFLYLVAVTGRRLSSEQMDELRAFFDLALSDAAVPS